MMKMMSLSLAATALAGSLVTASVTAADGCTDSFYCYGNSAEATVRTATRPPPIPPPNPNYTRQRNQAQLALRTSGRNAPATTRPAPRANLEPVAARQPARVTPVPTVRPQTRRAPPPAPVARTAPPRATPTPRANIRNVRPPLPVNRPPAVNQLGCSDAKQALLKRADGTESQAVIASTRGQRQRSVSLFRDAARMRSDAQRMQCR